jgi:hypothetical protein
MGNPHTERSNRYSQVVNRVIQPKEPEVTGADMTALRNLVTGGVSANRAAQPRNSNLTAGRGSVGSIAIEFPGFDRSQSGNWLGKSK